MNLAFDPCLLSASSENIPDHISYTQHSISLLKFSAVLFFVTTLQRKEKKILFGEHCYVPGTVTIIFKKKVCAKKGCTSGKGHAKNLPLNFPELFSGLTKQSDWKKLRSYPK